MTAPLYADPDHDRERLLGPRSNLGLWYTRFFDRYDPSWSLANDDAKREWIGQAANHTADSRNLGEIGELARRRITLVRRCGGHLIELRTTWHFVTGLGLPHPVENGFAWHPTLGLPYLPATGVKGLLRAWLWEVANNDNDRATRELAEERAKRWLGSLDRAGSLIFFDALPVEPPTLSADVMTPHMGKYYSEGGTIRDPNREPEKVPADWHSPIPVPFLVVREATFLFGIAPRRSASWDGLDSESEVATALEILQEALATFGAGAKTAVGYGRFGPTKAFLHRHDEQATINRERQDEANARRAALARFEGFEPSVIEVVGSDDLKGFTTRLLSAMDAQTWPETVCKELAKRLRGWMEERGEWYPNAKKHADKEEKNKKIKRTLAVMRWGAA